MNRRNQIDPMDSFITRQQSEEQQEQQACPMPPASLSLVQSPAATSADNFLLNRRHQQQTARRIKAELEADKPRLTWRGQYQNKITGQTEQVWTGDRLEILKAARQWADSRCRRCGGESERWVLFCPAGVERKGRTTAA